MQFHLFFRTEVWKIKNKMNKALNKITQKVDKMSVRDILLCIINSGIAVFLILTGWCGISEGKDEVYKLIGQSQSPQNRNEINTCDNAKIITLKFKKLNHCLTYNSHGVAYLYDYTVIWSGCIIFIIGAIYFFFLFKKREDLASQWLRNMSIYPIILIVFLILLTNSKLIPKDPQAITQFISLFSTLITGSATIKTWEKFWDYLDLLKKKNDIHETNATPPHPRCPITRPRRPRPRRPLR